MPIRSIARQLGIGRNTVRRALAADGPSKNQRPAKGPIVDAVEPQIRPLLAQWPTMRATVTAERISSTRSLTVLNDRMAGVAAVFSPADPASRTDYPHGKLAPVRPWFPPVDIPLGFRQLGRPPVLVMVSGYSRMLTARMIHSRQSPDLLAGHRTAPHHAMVSVPSDAGSTLPCHGSG